MKKNDSRMKKKLPIGIQKFPNMIKGDYIYIDKTETIFNLIDSGKYYFLSRPRRFGKSLLVSTLNEIFSGNRELFEGLWIYDKIEWVERPVIQMDFSRIGSKEKGLAESINDEFDEIAANYGVSLKASTNAEKFQELIQNLSKDKKIAILIDEYDKPIINNVENPEKAIESREILKNLYSVIKGNDDHIEFFLLTGVSKFSQVSIFSDLNNLEDITIDGNFSCLLGYTGEELQKYFPEYIAELQHKYRDIYPNILEAIKTWYNGYSWDGENFVYNPFSILNLFKKREFRDYWFSTGTPTFLMKLLKKNQYSILDLKNRKLNINFFNKFEISDIEINSLLFQSGYLTMKAYDFATNIVTLDFPNREVEQSFNIHLLAEFSDQSKEEAGSLL